MTTAVVPLLSLVLTLVVPGPPSPDRDTGASSDRSAHARPSQGRPAPSQAKAVWPLHPTPAVVSRFDPPLSRYGAGHRGVDLAGSPGQPVRAAAAGRVSFAGSIAGRGVVVVSHGGTRTTYEPVTAVVAVGAQVAAGDRIGTLQRGGSHCMPAACLHWGLVEGETYLDPLTLVGAGPVRLLPFLSGAG
jgi:murein DD-endopeptidase MepM/ murein hydrolase activator NlpD